MTRIRTVPAAEADDTLRKAREAQHALYPPEYDAPVLDVDSDVAGIVAAHSLIPDALYHAFATFGSLMSPDLPLTRRQHELIATVVSSANCTVYCTACHTEFLRRVTLDDALAEAVQRDVNACGLKCQIDLRSLSLLFWRMGEHGAGLENLSGILHGGRCRWPLLPNNAERPESAAWTQRCPLTPPRFGSCHAINFTDVACLSGQHS
jgi:AhpD family alkylhydroperoxidase